MRGEDSLSRELNTIPAGSPPHARGRRVRYIFIILPTRITPACAGKTLMKLASRLKIPDHPRMRGEDLLLGLSCRAALGSPPHARGRQREMSPSYASRRITPACAGKTLRRWEESVFKEDHPRMRGEDSNHLHCEGWEEGSPPHARGRPFCRQL